MDGHFCPICKGPLVFTERYPLVCPYCISRAEDGEGRQVQFFNTCLSGGLTGRYMDDGSPYSYDSCVIAGTHCRASESHMGGIVIEVL